MRHNVKCSLVLTPFPAPLPAVGESPKPAFEAANTATPGSVREEASTTSRPESRPERPSPQLSSLKDKVAAIQGLLSEFSAEVDALNHGSRDSFSGSTHDSVQGESRDAHSVSKADWMVDMQLIHHFTSNTAHTLSENPDFVHLWTTTVPQIAFSNVSQALSLSLSLSLGLRLPSAKPRRTSSSTASWPYRPFTWLTATPTRGKSTLTYLLATKTSPLASSPLA